MFSTLGVTRVAASGIGSSFVKQNFRNIQQRNQEKPQAMCSRLKLRAALEL